MSCKYRRIGNTHADIAVAKNNLPAGYHRPLGEKPQFCPSMPHLKQISLLQFKNYGQAAFSFGQRVIGISGPNGSGKTNLLDAIYYLCFTKSYFSGSDAQLVKKDDQGFRLSGTFDTGEGAPHEVVAILRENGKKEISWDGEPYGRVSAHVGRLPAVVIAPDDIEMITGASDARRKLADAMLCQIDGDYLQHLMAYNKILQQRNSLLKQMAERPNTPATVLEVLDEQLATRGAYIFQKRKESLLPFLQKATDHYERIAGKRDDIALQYISQLSSATADGPVREKFLQMLRQAAPRDRTLQRSTVGIHRDDLQFSMMDQAFKQTASQGQRKSLLFALKLTEYEWLEQAKGYPPLLLLDDVFEKLDDNRMHNLLTEVCLEKKGQVFITDTHQERLNESLTAIGIPFENIRL
ncbi:MAG TPA: DNA replication and repair protein RecF [Phnomibacter sp.]|nr:DNA replication and repair protein RecF [Phnomibacter sp.]